MKDSSFLRLCQFIYIWIHVVLDMLKSPLWNDCLKTAIPPTHHLRNCCEIIQNFPSFTYLSVPNPTARHVLHLCCTISTHYKIHTKGKKKKICVLLYGECLFSSHGSLTGSEAAFEEMLDFLCVWVCVYVYVRICVCVCVCVCSACEKKVSKCVCLCTVHDRVNLELHVW